MSGKKIEIRKGGGKGAFISFSDVAESRTISTTMVVLSSPVYTGQDAELSQACKRLTKKDSITKLKAILEITEIFKIRGEAVILDFLPYFAHAFPRLLLENNRKVREHLATIFLAVIAVDKRLLGPYMKQLIGPWWTLSCDPCGEVAELFSTAFTTAIPIKKRAQVLSFLAPDLIAYCVKNINQKAETLSDMSTTTPEEAEEKYERILISTVMGMSKLVSAPMPLFILSATTYH